MDDELMIPLALAFERAIRKREDDGASCAHINLGSMEFDEYTGGEILEAAATLHAMGYFIVTTIEFARGDK